MSVTVHLTDDEVRAIQSQQTEGGGFQGLFKKLLEGLTDNTLTVEKETARRAISYCGSYGGGGWQDDLESIASKLKAELS